MCTILAIQKSSTKANCYDLIAMPVPSFTFLMEQAVSISSGFKCPPGIYQKLLSLLINNSFLFHYEYYNCYA
ncbi:MAG: hypothetical protein NQ127_00985 [Candidatus Cardinium sp.]|nr:hypothetical protein [Candidatus Cardinium sp.]